MCIFVLNNKDKIMTKIFYLPPLWYKYPPYFFIFCNRERICLYNRYIILAALIRHNIKINMTKNCEIVIFKKKNRYDIFAISPTPPLTVRITL